MCGYRDTVRRFIECDEAVTPEDEGAGRWVTMHGTIFTYAQLEDDHLRNIILYLHRLRYPIALRRPRLLLEAVRRGVYGAVPKPAPDPVFEGGPMSSKRAREALHEIVKEIEEHKEAVMVHPTTYPNPMDPAECAVARIEEIARKALA